MNARRQIIAALSEDSLGGIATLQDVDHATQLVDAVVAEAFLEAAAEAESTVALFEDSEEGAAAAGAMEGLAIRFRRMAREKTTAKATAPSFFQPGHVYAREHHGDTAEFDVRHIEPAPDGGRVAFGFYRRQPHTSWHPYSSDDLADWADVTSEVTA